MDSDHQPAPQAELDQPISAAALSKLKWRCRRGLLENDLFIERFFAQHEHRLTQGQAAGLEELMDLSDNDLLDFFLQRQAADTSRLSVQAQHVLNDLFLGRQP